MQPVMNCKQSMNVSQCYYIIIMVLVIVIVIVIVIIGTEQQENYLEQAIPADLMGDYEKALQRSFMKIHSQKTPRETGDMSAQILAFLFVEEKALN